MNSKIIENDEIIIAGQRAWNTLTDLIGQENVDAIDDLEEFRVFYAVVIEKLLETEAED